MPPAEICSLDTSGESVSWPAARAYVFTDVGQVRLRDPLPEQQSSFPLWSVGIGGSFKLAEHVSGRVDLASPLKAGARTELHDPRVTFSVNANY